MKKKLYYSDLFEFKDEFAENLAGLFAIVISYPKFTLDVFLRRNMGERHYSFIKVFGVGIALYFLPKFFGMYGEFSPTKLYYGFYAAYWIMCLIRYLEIRREPSVFDFAKYSKSTGLPYYFFYKIRITGEDASLRSIDLYYEPLLCMIIGLALLFLGEHLTGAVIFFSAICYGFYNHMAAAKGDNSIMDKIDEIICNEDMTESFASNKELTERQVPLFSRKPNTEELRQRLVNELFDEDEDAATAS